MTPTDLPLEQYGFDKLFDVSERTSISDLIKGPRRRCGVYLLIFSDGQYYIGQATDVTTRFVRHRKTYDDITHLAFQKVAKSNLDEVEQALIHKAEADGYKLRNVSHVSVVLGETNLDNIIPREVQETWIETGQLSHTGRRRLENLEAQRIKYQRAFDKLCDHPRYSEVLELLKLYVLETIPIPLQTEQTFWSLSCMPSTSVPGYQRYAIININSMETLAIMYDKQSPDEFVVHLYVAKSRLFANKGKLRFRLKHMWVGIDQIGKLKPAGQDQTILTSYSLETAILLLRNSEVTAAARRINLNLMRKGATINAKYHCAHLADQILGDVGS